jgi:hypothetical protein
VWAMSAVAHGAFWRTNLGAPRAGRSHTRELAKEGP